VASQDYCFQVDLAWRALLAGFEVPITFFERVRGTSKISGDIVRESLVRVTWWALVERSRQVLRLSRGQRLRPPRRISAAEPPRTGYPVPSSLAARVTVGDDHPPVQHLRRHPPPRRGIHTARLPRPLPRCALLALRGSG